MSFRIHRALVFCILIGGSLLLAYTPSAAAATVSIPVSIKGLPPEFLVAITVDGVQQGTIPGGGSRSFKVDSKKPHTFQLDAEIKGPCASYEGKSVCSRYKCTSNLWNLDVISTQNCQSVPVCYEVYVCDYWGCYWDYYCSYEQQCWSTTELSEKGHTFEYFAEHHVIVDSVHGQNVDDWIKDGADLNISADESVVLRDETNVKERDIFQAWIANGASIESRNLALKIDKPYYIRAEYQTETRVRVRVSSDFGNPTTDNPDGWYTKGQEATVSIEKELPLEGFWGMLGGKRVFTAWQGLGGTESRQPTFSFTVNEPTDLSAQWTTDNSAPMFWLGVLGVALAIVIALFILMLYRKRRTPEAKETGELEKAKAEIEELKTEMEDLKAKKHAAKKKEPEAEEEEQP